LAADFSITGSRSGTIKQLTVSADISVATADAGQPGVYFVAAKLFGIWVFKQSSGNWVVWSGGEIPPYASGPLVSQTISVVSQLDLSAFPDVQFLVGYGLTLDDMLTKQKYALVGSAPTGALAGSWVIAPDGGGNDVFHFGSGLILGQDGSFTFLDDCYGSGSYTQTSDTITMTLQVFKPNPNPDKCGTPAFPVGTTLSVQYVVSGDSMATYLGNARGVWQRLSPPVNRPIGAWKLASRIGDTYSAGETLTINADGSFTHVDGSDDPQGCVMTGSYTLQGNLLTATQASAVPTPTGTCAQPGLPGQTIALLFSYDASVLTTWHGNSMDTWVGSGN
jgi:hypothetical protein